MNRVERGLISTQLAKTRDYCLTKKNLDNMMFKYEEYIYKCHEIKPPVITTNYQVKYEKFLEKSTDQVGNYVAEKLDLLKEVDLFYQELKDALLGLCIEELAYFNNYYFRGLSEVIICDKLNIGEGSLRRIKESCVIKVAMYFDIDVKITE